MQDALRTFRKVSLQLEHSGPSHPLLRTVHSTHTHTRKHTHRHFVKVDQPLRSATLLSSCARRWRDAGSLKRVQKNLLRDGGSLSHSGLSKKKRKGKKKRKKICVLVGAGRKGSAESRCICVRLTDPPSTVPLEARVVTHTCQLCPRSIFFYGGERDPSNDPVIYFPPVTAHTCSMSSAMFQHISV